LFRFSRLFLQNALPLSHARDYENAVGYYETPSAASARRFTRR
jgi:hypothetical protein